MANQKKNRNVSEAEARAVAEASRQSEWTQPSFMRQMFLGRFRLDLIHPYPLPQDERPEFTKWLADFKEFLMGVDSAAIDDTGEYPEDVLEGLRKLGAFGMKIPKEYGGLGFSQIEYAKAMELLGSVDGNLTALLSAHQSIGVPQPLKLFGSEAQKKEYLPRCARGEISAFALTEPDVGSDPARMSTLAEPTEDGEAYILNGVKLWCTNGTLAKLLVVMALDTSIKKISAFVVETGWEGVSIDTRCHFMGLKALANAVISFKDVRVPKANLIGSPGRGLKIALTTLNDGRLSIPNASVGGAKKALQICTKWANERVQWGKPVGKHEAIAHKLTDMAANTFAMESMARLATHMSDQGSFDIRLEAAAAKEWNTSRGWEIVDDAMQIRGGRGYETELSLENRGEEPIGVERMMRDYRINRIFEGSNEIMHLFMAREAVDKHLQVAGDMINPKKPMGAKLAALPKIGLFYAWWYPNLWLRWSLPPRYASFGNLAGHLRFVERKSRKLAREVFHGMMIHQAKMERKQMFLFRLVDVANELFAMASSVSRAHAMRQANHPEAEQAVELADIFCRSARRKVNKLFGDLWGNEDDRKYRVAKRLLEGHHDAWMNGGTIELLEGLEARARQRAASGETADVEAASSDVEKAQEPAPVG
ncbi:MAG TPA: acyl-CoA dehydrogenase family protein [Acidobacteriota bacterium]|nr:acyl-CoA dehydrogenase family protein [Acidobacteriota bacterium]